MDSFTSAPRTSSPSLAVFVNPPVLPGHKQVHLDLTSSFISLHSIFWLFSFVSYDKMASLPHLVSSTFLQSYNGNKDQLISTTPVFLRNILPWILCGPKVHARFCCDNNNVSHIFVLFFVVLIVLVCFEDICITVLIFPFAVLLWMLTSSFSCWDIWVTL